MLCTHGRQLDIRNTAPFHRALEDSSEARISRCYRQHEHALLHQYPQNHSTNRYIRTKRRAIGQLLTNDDYSCRIPQVRGHRVQHLRVCEECRAQSCPWQRLSVLSCRPRASARQPALYCCIGSGDVHTPMPCVEMVPPDPASICTASNTRHA